MHYKCNKCIIIILQGRVTAAGSGWITVRLADGLLRRFRPYNLEEVDHNSTDYKSFEDREHLIESHVAVTDEKSSIEFQREQKEALNTSADFQPSHSKLQSLTIADDDYLNMNIDSDLLLCNAEEPQEERVEVVEEAKIDQNTVEELFQLFEEEPMDTAVDNPVPTNTHREKFSYPDRKFVPLNQKPPKVKYLQFSLSKEVFEQKYKVSKPLTLMPKLDPKKISNPISQHGPAVLSTNQIDNTSILNEDIKSVSNANVASSSSSSNSSSAVSQPPLPSGSRVQKVNRPGSMSRNLRLQRNRDDLAAIDDDDASPTTTSNSAVATNSSLIHPPQSGLIKFITIMNEDGDLVSIPEPITSTLPEDLNSNFDKQLPQLPLQQSKDSVVQDVHSFQGQRLRRQQHILEQQRLAQQRQQHAHPKVLVDDPRNSFFSRDEKSFMVSSEDAAPFDPSLQTSSVSSNPIQTNTLEEQLTYRTASINVSMAENTMDNHNGFPEARKGQADGSDQVVRNSLDPRLRLHSNRKVSDSRTLGNSLSVVTELSSAATARGDRGCIDTVVPQNDYRADPAALNGKKRKSRFSHHEPLSTSQDAHHGQLHPQQWQDIPDPQLQMQQQQQQQQEHQLQSLQFDTPHLRAGSLQNPKRKSRFNQLPDAIPPGNRIEDSFPSQTNDISLNFAVDSTHFHDNYNEVGPPYQQRQPLEGGHQYPIIDWGNRANDDFYNEANRFHGSGGNEWKYPIPLNDVRGLHHQSLDETRLFGEYQDPTARDAPSNSSVSVPVSEPRCAAIYGRATHDESSIVHRSINDRLSNISVDSNSFNRGFNAGSEQNKASQEERAFCSATNSINRSGDKTAPSAEKSISENGLPPDNSTFAAAAAAAAMDPISITKKSETMNVSSANAVALSSKTTKDSDLEDGEVIEEDDLEEGEVVEDGEEDSRQNDPPQETVAVVREFGNFVAKQLLNENNIAVAMPIIAPCLPSMEVMFGHNSHLPLSERTNPDSSRIEHLPLEENDMFSGRHQNSTFHSISTSTHAQFLERQSNPSLNPPLPPPTYVRLGEQVDFMDRDVFTERTPYHSASTLTHPRQNMNMYMEGQFDPAIHAPPHHTAYIDGPPNHGMDVAVHPLPAYHNMTIERAIESDTRVHPSQSHSMFVNSNTYLERQVDPVTYHHNAYVEQAPAHNTDAIRAYNPSHAHHISFMDDRLADHRTGLPPLHRHQFEANNFEPTSNLPVPRQYLQWDSADAPQPSNSHHHFLYNTESSAYPMTRSNAVAPPMHSHSNPSHYVHPPLPPRNQGMEHHSSQSQQLFPNAYFVPPPPQYSQP